MLSDQFCSPRQGNHLQKGLEKGLETVLEACLDLKTSVINLLNHSAWSIVYTFLIPKTRDRDHFACWDRDLQKGSLESGPETETYKKGDLSLVLRPKLTKRESWVCSWDWDVQKGRIWDLQKDILSLVLILRPYKVGVWSRVPRLRPTKSESQV